MKDNRIFFIPGPDRSRKVTNRHRWFWKHSHMIDKMKRRNPGGIQSVDSSLAVWQNSEFSPHDFIDRQYFSLIFNNSTWDICVLNSSKLTCIMDWASSMSKNIGIVFISLKVYRPSQNTWNVEWTKLILWFFHIDPLFQFDLKIIKSGLN